MPMLHAGGYFSEIVAHTYIWVIVFGFDSKSGHTFFLSYSISTC